MPQVLGGGVTREVIGEVRWHSLCLAGIAHLNLEACQSYFPSLDDPEPSQ